MKQNKISSRKKQMSLENEQLTTPIIWPSGKCIKITSGRRVFLPSNGSISMKNSIVKYDEFFLKWVSSPKGKECFDEMMKEFSLSSSIFHSPSIEMGKSNGFQPLQSIDISMNHNESDDTACCQIESTRLKMTLKSTMEKDNFQKVVNCFPYLEPSMKFECKNLTLEESFDTPEMRRLMDSISLEDRVTGLSFEQLLSLLNLHCECPKFIGALIFRRLTKGTTLKIPLIQLLKFWSEQMGPFDNDERLFNLLRKSNTDIYLYPEDLHPLIEEIVRLHQGLDFLSETPHFQQRYAETVTTRIFYTMTRNKRACITRKSLKSNRFYELLKRIDEQKEINAVCRGISFRSAITLFLMALSFRTWNIFAMKTFT